MSRFSRYSVCVRNRQHRIDPERVAAAIAKHSPLSEASSNKCAQLVMDPNESAESTLICMQSLGAADDLTDALIDIGVDARIIDHELEA